MPTIINGTTGIDKVQDGTITSSDLASGAALANIGAGGITPSYLSTQSQYTGFKNRIINGAMMIDQRNAGASVTANDSVFIVDRWKMEVTQSSKLTGQQNAGSVTPPSGFRNYLGLTSSSAYSVGAGDYFLVDQILEGFNTADLMWGTASASPITLSFWVRSSLTGTFGGSLANDASNRSYPFTYTISAANTWEQKSVTVTGDTSGTWLTTNGVGLRLRFGLGAGATYSGTAGAWAGSVYVSATGATSVVGTSGATFYITGVQLEKGSTATSFDYRPYGTELALCQRYFVKTNSNNGTSAFGGLTGNSYSSSYGVVSMRLPVTMRTSPTVTRGGTNDTFYMAGLDAARAATVASSAYDPQGIWWEVTGSLSSGGYQMTYNGQASISAEL